MTIIILFLLFLNVHLVVMLRFETSVAEKVWSERCARNSIALNDCNWCHCDPKSQYTCQARACNEVDMFGHFNDAIANMDVGMEGRGVWRSEKTPCEPGVHYRKNELLCVCTEEGTWPNPVCRDIFRVLHSVEMTDSRKPAANTSCSPTKLYLYDCNVCFCPESGLINPSLCTTRKCENEKFERTQAKDGLIEEIYASCTPSKRYRLGCQTCVCLRNNRLLCDNCTVEERHDVGLLQNTACYQKKPGTVFKKACNFCHCNKKDTIFCTAKKCLQDYTQISLPLLSYEEVQQSEDEFNCVPGTKYEKDCNTCHCFMFDGVKYFGCTVKMCKHPTELLHDRTCVEGTSYQINCLICHCVLDNDEKREYCTIDETCKTADKGTRDLSTMHGYCEPMHFYQLDCNKCRCLADGKTVACTSKLCLKKREKPKQIFTDNRGIAKFRADLKPATEQPMMMEFIPFVQKDNYCPKGQTYMVDCNVCYCMKTGNAVCTTKQC